jgi:ABC-type sugar transport system ATPase subunit
VEREPFALEMLNISKSFPGVRALDDVSFGCARGEVHALCGENGAGKSTLTKILGGASRPDRGHILLDGQEVEFPHPVASRRAGVSIIHQELSLLPHRSVAENIFLGMEPTRYGMLDRPKMRDDAERLLARLGSSIPAETGAGNLSIAQQQLVEIAKALAIDARILVMDEPTAALDRDDAARLLDLVRERVNSSCHSGVVRPSSQSVANIAIRMQRAFTVTPVCDDDPNLPNRRRDVRPPAFPIIGEARVCPLLFAKG